MKLGAPHPKARGRAPMNAACAHSRAGPALAVCFADANATEYRGRAAASDVLLRFRPRNSTEYRGSARTASRPSARAQVTAVTLRRELHMPREDHPWDSYANRS
jgi:hypothetical protein